VSARGDHTTARVLHTCRPILHFFCRGWSDPAAPTNMPSSFSRFGVVGWTLTQVSLWEVVWVFKEFSFPLLTPPLPTHLIVTWPTYLLLNSFSSPPTYQSPTYLFPCTLPHSCTHLIFHVFFFLVNKLATPCSLMLLHCFFFSPLTSYEWQVVFFKKLFLTCVLFLDELVALQCSVVTLFIYLG